MKGAVRGHVLAGATILVWGITFVSSKVLLEGMAPVEVLFLRFLLGYAALWVFAPRMLKVSSWRHEARFVAAGACGVALYFLMENIALTFTTATNVSVVVAVAPLFTGLVAMLVLKKTQLSPFFFAGFAVALCGIVTVGAFGEGGSAQAAGVAAQAVGAAAQVAGDGDFAANAIGCLMAVAGALAWAVYCNISNAISVDGYNVLLATRRTFFWGLVLLAPTLPLLGFDPDWNFILQPKGVGNLLFLGLLASATCYVTWNKAVKEIGPVATSAYIYVQPVVTIVVAMMVLGESLTLPIAIGAALTIAGLVLSEWKGRKPRAGRMLPK